MELLTQGITIQVTPTELAALAQAAGTELPDLMVTWIEAHNSAPDPSSGERYEEAKCSLAARGLLAGSGDSAQPTPPVAGMLEVLKSPTWEVGLAAAEAGQAALMMWMGGNEAQGLCAMACQPGFLRVGLVLHPNDEAADLLDDGLASEFEAPQPRMGGLLLRGPGASCELAWVHHGTTLSTFEHVADQTTALEQEVPALRDHIRARLRSVCFETA